MIHRLARLLGLLALLCGLLLALPASAATTYSLPTNASTLPGNCSHSSGTITCANNATFTDITTLNFTQDVTWVIHGSLTTNQSFTINANGHTVNIQIDGNLVTNNQFYNYGANISTGGYIDIQNQVTSTGNLSAGTTLTLRNDANITGNLSAASSIDIQNNATINGSLTTTASGSNITFRNQITVSGDINSAGSLNIQNNANITGNITTTTTLTINNNLNLNGNITTGGDIVIDNNSTITGDVSSGEDITIRNNFTLTGSITAAGTLQINNSYTISGNCTAVIYDPPDLVCSYALMINATSSVSEGNSGTTNLPFTVTLSKSRTSTVTVQYSTTNGTATGGSSCTTGIDYISASNTTVTFAAGETSKTINIQVCGDTAQEPDETFTVTLSNPSNGVLDNAHKTGTGTILNDDTSTVSSFNAVDTGANGVSGKIGTKVVGSAFSVDVVALNSARTAVDTSINQQVKVELIANANAANIGSNNCPSTGTAISVGTPTLSSGKATVSVAAVSSAYRDVRVRVSYPATGTATVIACSTDNFAIRPASLSLAVQDSHWGAAGTSRDLNNIALSGGVVHKAGQPFTVGSTAYANNGSTQVSNYDGNATLVLGQCATTDVCPVVGALGSFASGGTALTALSFSGGSVSNSGVSYSEVGGFVLQLQDTTYANVDNGDGTSADCNGRYACSSAIDVGRFVPDHYAVSSSQTPILQTFGSSCASRSFTYLGQNFGFATLPKALITAQNAGNTTTANYKNTLWKVAANHLTTTWSCQAGSGACPATTINAPAFSNSDIFVGGNGTGTFTWPTNTTYPTGMAQSLARTTATPLTAFTPTFGLTVTIADTSETGCGTTPCTLIDNQGSAKTWSNVAFDSGGEFRHGRLKIGNAYGATTLDLAIPLEVQYYNSGSFVTNTADNCTTITAGSIGLRNPQRNLVAAEIGGHVNLSGTSFAAGQKKLRLAKPSSGDSRYDGTIDVFAYLASDSQCAVSGGTVTTPAPSTANLPYLQDNWPWDHNGTSSGSVNCQNPVGRATFGLERQKFLYQREQY